jgi:hypothetical protein
MNAIQAKMILDRVREGWDYSEATITRAIFMTGEISEHEFRAMEGGMRSPGVGCPLQDPGPGVWPGRGAGVVG